MKNLLTILLILVICFLFGCGDDTTTNNNNGAQNPNEVLVASYSLIELPYTATSNMDTVLWVDSNNASKTFRVTFQAERNFNNVVSFQLIRLFWNISWGPMDTSLAGIMTDTVLTYDKTFNYTDEPVPNIGAIGLIYQTQDAQGYLRFRDFKVFRVE